MKKLTSFALAGLFVAVGIAAVVTLSPRVNRTVVREATLADISSQEILSLSRLVVVGRVVGIDTVTAPSSFGDGKTDVYSDVRIQVTKTLLASGAENPKTVTVRLLGGEAPGLRVLTPESSLFRMGDEVLAYVRIGDDGTFRLTAGVQSGFRLGADGSVGVGEQKALARRVFGKDVTLQDVEASINRLQQ